MGPRGQLISRANRRHRPPGDFSPALFTRSGHDEKRHRSIRSLRHRRRRHRDEKRIIGNWTRRPPARSGSSLLEDGGDDGAPEEKRETDVCNPSVRDRRPTRVPGGTATTTRGVYSCDGERGRKGGGSGPEGERDYRPDTAVPSVSVVTILFIRLEFTGAGKLGRARG